MFKKLISFMLCTALACTAVGINANADAPIYYEGITTNVFDVDFADVDSTAQAPEFTFDGKWQFPGQFVTMSGTASGSIKTKNKIDLSGANGYEFSAQTIMTQNAMNIFLAYDEATNSGYKVNVSRKNSKLTVYRAGTDETLGEAASVSITYAAPVVWKARFENNVLTIYMGSTEVFSATETQAAGLVGTFGVASSSIEDFAVLNMKLDKLGNGVNVNNWRYENDFASYGNVDESTDPEAAKAVIDKLAADGITFTKSKSAGKFIIDGKGGFKIGKGPGTVNIYYNKEFSGDATFETNIYSYTGNAATIRFNESSDGSYYALRFIKSNSGKNTDNIALVKYDASTKATTYLASKTSTSINQYSRHTMTFKDNGESVTVTAKVQNNAGTASYGTVSYDIPKSELFSPKHKIHINSGNVSETSSGVVRYYYFKLYSTPSNETAARDVDLLNKKFVTGDTATSLKKEGITVTAPTSISTIDGGLNSYGNTKDGMYWNNSNSSGSTYHAYVTCDKTVSGDYTFSAKTKAQQNATTFQINRTDNNNQYEVIVSANSHKITINKIHGGTTTATASSALTNSKGEVITSGLYGYGMTTTIDVKNNEDGTLTIKADVYAKSGDIIGSCELIDTTGEPLTSGICRIHFDKNQGSYRMLYEMKITQHGTYTEDGAFTGRFYIDGEEVTSYKKGAIYFETPVVDMGTYEVVAALYEDNKMTDIKTLTPREIYEGKVLLFDTTGSDALSGSVKVFFLDSGDTLNKTMDVWELR